MTPAEIAESLRVLVGGDKVTSFRDGDERYDVVLRADLKDRDSLDAVSRLLYSTDASIYQIEPLGVVVPKTQADVEHAIRIAVES